MLAVVTVCVAGAKGLSHTFSLDDDCDEDYVEAGDEAPITPVSPSSSHSADPTTAVNGIEVRTGTVLVAGHNDRIVQLQY